MNSPKWFAPVLASGALALGLAACGDDTSSSGGVEASGSTPTDLSGDLAGAGSSAQDAAQQAWIAGIQSASSDLTVSYDPIGSGGGREQFNSGAVAFAGTDSSFADEELDAAVERCGDGEFVQIPVYISPIAVIYNLDGVDSLQLTPDLIAGIFSQQITTWDDPAIAKENPDAELPSTRITPVNRSDDSGTTANFTDYMSKTAPEVWTDEPDDTWPIKGGEAAEGTSGVVEAVKSGDGTVGYADASQAKGLGIADIQVGSEFVAPSAEGATAVVDESKEDTSAGQYVYSYEINRTTTSPDSYPLILVSYEAACTTYDSDEEATNVNGYLNYIISPEGQDAAAQAAGSAPISDQLREQIQPAVDAIGS